MTADTAPIPADLPCHVCGYDLRAHAPDGVCPECGGSVEEARRVAAVPLRPAWRDSDPRWRRRVLAGVWLLALLPLMDALEGWGLASGIPVPGFFESGRIVRTLDETFLCRSDIYPRVVFCMGVVLLFARERRRRRGRLDWTRRWGVLCSYVSLLLSAVQVLFLGALVMTGIAALLETMPLNNQPRATPLFVHVFPTYLRYGAHPSDAAAVVLVAVSSLAVLPACVALFDALRSSGRPGAAAALLAPLALLALVHLWQAGRCLVWGSFAGIPPSELYRHAVYFSPSVLVNPTKGLPLGPSPSAGDVVLEAVKWSVVFAAALWLTVAQLLAWRGRRQSPSAKADGEAGNYPAG